MEQKDGGTMDFLHVFGWTMLILGAYYVAIGVLFCFPQNCARTVGRLEKTKNKKNVRVCENPGHKTMVAPHWTSYTYSYTVNGKTYKKSGAVAKSPRQLPYQPSVVYLKWIPRYGFVKGMTMFQRPLWGCFLTFVSIIFIII